MVNTYICFFNSCIQTSIPLVTLASITNEMKMSYYYTMLLLIIVSVSTSPNGICRADPTDGFTRLPLNDDNIKLQKPYNEPLDDRYSFDDGVRKL